MIPKERVLRAINREQVDRPPVFATLTPQVAKKLSEHIDMPYEEALDSMLSTRISHMDLLTTLGNDCVGISACAPVNRPTGPREDGNLVNEWGMVFTDTGLYNEFIEFPLAHAVSKSDILDYTFPDPNAEGRYDEARKTIAKYGDSHAIVGDIETSFWETSWYLVGLEKLMLDMMLESPYVETLFDRVMEINLEIGSNLIRLGADMLWAGDDFGSQSGMMLDPETWRKIFKPRIKYMFEEWKKVNPDIKIAWHTCGSVVPIIDDFIEIGLDVLNPMQPLAKDMDAENLISKFGERIAYFGGIDIQELLPQGPVERIKSEVMRIAGIYGKNSGYILAPAHNIQDDTPMEHILAFFEAVKEL
ncbi:uroporphyrinogen decarboxylase family protein [Bacteroidota bacterium]